MNKVNRFLTGDYPEDSYHAVLKNFLLQQKQQGVSKATVDRLFYSLYPIGESLGNPSMGDVQHTHLTAYATRLWLLYAPDSVRTFVGDIRQFFKWCKRRGYHKKNLAKQIAVSRNKRRRSKRQSKAPAETAIRHLMEFLANQLGDLVYRDVFGILQINGDGWSSQSQKALRDLFVITFLYETGARVGELSTLGSRNMNEATAEPQRTYGITLTGKTGERDYLFTQSTAELWRVWEQVRPDGANEYAVLGWGNGHMKRGMRPNGISQMIARRCQEAKIKPFRAHALRHAKIKRGRVAVGLETTSILVDHSDLRSTRGYANIDDEELTEAAIKTGVQFDLWRPKP